MELYYLDLEQYVFKEVIAKFKFEPRNYEQEEL
jgi:hypothetical protein